MVDILVNKIKPKPSKAYPAFWKFIEQRQKAFWRRQKGYDAPWCDDSIIQKHKFTNVYRAADRTSQYLIRHVIYDGDQQPAELFFRILFFKLFNRIELWEHLEQIIGHQPRWDEFTSNVFGFYDRELQKMLANKMPVFTSAYIAAPGGATGGGFKFPMKHQNYLALIQYMMSDGAGYRVQDSEDMEEVFGILKSYPIFADFMAYQIATDVNYSTLTNFSEMSFVAAGPGAKNGLSIMFESFGDYKPNDIIRRLVHIQEKEFKRYDLKFKNLFGRRIQYIDMQNCCCEMSKYSRAKFPDMQGKVKRTKIKMEYHPHKDFLKLWFPPKWGLNEKVERFYRKYRPEIVAKS